MQRNPGCPFCSVGIPGQDGGMLIMRLRQAKLAPVGPYFSHQIAVDQVLVELTLDRLGLRKRQLDRRPSGSSVGPANFECLMV